MVTDEEKLVAKSQCEDTVRSVVDAWNEQTIAICYRYLRNSGWDTDKANRVIRETFG